MLGFFRANIPAAIFAGLAAVFAFIAIAMSVQLNGFLFWDGARDKLDKTRTELGKCVIGRKEDRTRYAQAQADAAAKNRADVERIKADQEQINDDTERKYQADRARLQRELAGRLLGPNPAPQGSSGSAGAGPDGPPSGKPDEAAKVCIPPSDYVHGAETELQLDALIGWVERQLGVKR